jgi:hypothetical protein
MAGHVLGLARLAPEHVHRHLFVVRALLGEQHPDCPDIRAAVETVENDPSHFIFLLLGPRATAVSCGQATVAPAADLQAFAFGGVAHFVS